MPRTPTVRYFDSRKAYFTTFKGRQHCLASGPKDEPDGPTYRAAVQKFSEVIHVAEAGRAEDDNLVITILDRYAVHLKNQGRERTLEMFRRCCDSAVQDFGHLKYKDLKIMHVQEWLDRMGLERGRSRGNRIRKWGHTMKRLAVDKLQAAFSWAVQLGRDGRGGFLPGARHAAFSYAGDQWSLSVARRCPQPEWQRHWHSAAGTRSIGPKSRLRNDFRPIHLYILTDLLLA